MNQIHAKDKHHGPSYNLYLLLFNILCSTIFLVCSRTIYFFFVGLAMNWICLKPIRVFCTFMFDVRSCFNSYGPWFQNWFKHLHLFLMLNEILLCVFSVIIQKYQYQGSSVNYDFQNPFGSFNLMLNVSLVFSIPWSLHENGGEKGTKMNNNIEQCQRRRPTNGKYCMFIKQYPYTKHTVYRPKLFTPNDMRIGLIFFHYPFAFAFTLAKQERKKHPFRSKFSMKLEKKIMECTSYGAQRMAYTVCTVHNINVEPITHKCIIFDFKFSYVKP